MAKQHPLWRKTFDAVERPIGNRLEALVQTGPFIDALTLTRRLQRRLQQRLQHAQRQLLHLGNLPARTDVARLSEQVARLERQLRDLSTRLEDEESSHGEHPDAR
jgi:hypothetical protein